MHSYLLASLLSFIVLIPHITFAEVPNYDALAADIKARLERGVNKYQGGDIEAGKISVQMAYFEVFENLEGPIRINTSAQLSFKLEKQFGEIRKMIIEVKPVAEVQAEVDNLNLGIAAALEEVKATGHTVAGGPDTINIDVSLIDPVWLKAYQLGTIYNSCIWALVLSAATTYLLKGVFDVSGASQEILEGATMLIAVVVLFFVSHWLISKAESSKWDQYIKDKMSDSLSKGSLWGPWFAVFLAAYREGAETILFYFALASQGSGSQSTIAMVEGGFSGCSAAYRHLPRYAVHLSKTAVSSVLPFYRWFALPDGLCLCRKGDDRIHRGQAL